MHNKIIKRFVDTLNLYRYLNLSTSYRINLSISDNIPNIDGLHFSCDKPRISLFRNFDSHEIYMEQPLGLLHRIPICFVPVH
jgi:hypothetical protein